MRSALKSDPLAVVVLVLVVAILPAIMFEAGRRVGLSEGAVSGPAIRQGICTLTGGCITVTPSPRPTCGDVTTFGDHSPIVCGGEINGGVRIQ